MEMYLADGASKHFALSAGMQVLYSTLFPPLTMKMTHADEGGLARVHAAGQRRADVGPFEVNAQLR